MALEKNSESTVLTRRNLEAFALLGLTLVSLAACLALAAPFWPAITWALALAIVARPIHRKLLGLTGRPQLAAGLAVAVVVGILAIPMLLLVQQLATEARQEAHRLQELMEPGAFREAVAKVPQGTAVVNWLGRYVDWNSELSSVGHSLRTYAGSFLRGSVWTGVQMLITCFFLFYLFLDRHAALRTLRRYAPLSDPEADSVIERVRVMVRATLYGTFSVAAVQGILGGLMFWILGLPAPLLWGSAMAMLAVIPTLGPFLIWMPAAVGLALQGSWMKALLLAGWGMLAVGLVDNWLQPFLVGKEVKVHTVPVFVSIVGGMILFGVSGLVLGPAALALSMALFTVVRKRTRDGGSVQDEAGQDDAAGVARESKTLVER